VAIGLQVLLCGWIFLDSGNRLRTRNPWFRILLATQVRSKLGRRLFPMVEPEIIISDKPA